MPRRQPKEPTCKVLAFSYEDLHFSLPIESIRKVMRLPRINKSATAPLGIAMVGEEEVLVLDLYQNIYQREIDFSQPKQYFITLAHQDNIYGIPVPQLPVLEEIPISALKPTPSTYRTHDPLGIASHVFQKQNQTYFLIDPDSLLQALIAKQSIVELAEISVSKGAMDTAIETGDDQLAAFFSEPAVDRMSIAFAEPETTHTELVLGISEKTSLTEQVDTMSDLMMDVIAFAEPETTHTEPVLGIAEETSIAEDQENQQESISSESEGMLAMYLDDTDTETKSDECFSQLEAILASTEAKIETTDLDFDSYFSDD
ncbi:MAG: chemotaxis protein CheW [Pseudanabaenaceae cyanobacterium]